MSVIFGWYSFKVKSYNAKDLELEEEKWKNSDFEIRQKVFHLFWLPFFSLGKVYALRKNGNLYDLPELIQSRLKAKKVKTPWYSFFLPIALITGLIGFGLFIYVAESIMKHKNHLRKKELYETSINEVENRMKDLKLNSYLRILSPNKNKSTHFLKLVDINDDVYNFQQYQVNHPKRSTEDYYWEKLTSDTISLTKNELNSAICADYDSLIDKKCGFNILGDSRKYVIDQIDFFDTPVIDGNIDWYFWHSERRRKFQYYNTLFTGYKKNLSWSFKLRFQNFGIPVDLVQINNIKNNVQWVDSLPIKFKSYEYLKDIYIKVNTFSDPDTLNFKSKFIFEDSLKNQYEYIVTGNQSWYEINRN